MGRQCWQPLNKRTCLSSRSTERRWYRYHHLFADVLNRRLEQTYPGLLPDLHRRASRWCEQNALFFEAIRHARQANDLERAAQLLDQHGCLLLMRGEVTNLLRTIESVEPYSQVLPWIALQKAWALCLTGQADQAEGALEAAVRLVAPLPLTDAKRTMLGLSRPLERNWPTSGARRAEPLSLPARRWTGCPRAAIFRAACGASPRPSWGMPPGWTASWLKRQCAHA